MNKRFVIETSFRCIIVFRGHFSAILTSLTLPSNLDLPTNYVPVISVSTPAVPELFRDDSERCIWVSIVCTALVVLPSYLSAAPQSSHEILDGVRLDAR